MGREDGYGFLLTSPIAAPSKPSRIGRSMKTTQRTIPFNVAIIDHARRDKRKGIYATQLPKEPAAPRWGRKPPQMAKNTEA